MTDPRRAKSRDALIQAGIVLFGENSADSISVDDIVRVSGVAKQTFYNHFIDKADLVKAILRSVRSEYESRTETVNAQETNAARRVARALCVYARLTLDDPKRGRFVGRMLMEDMGAGESNRGVVNDITAGLAQNRFTLPALDTGVAFIFGVTQALSAKILTCSRLADTVALSRQFAILLLRALGIAQPDAEAVAGEAADRIVGEGFV